MTLEDVKAIDLFQTRSIAEACKDNPAYNNADLAAGEGHILARYKAKYNLESDIYIEAHFSKSIPGIDANNTMVMYCNER